MVSAEAIDMEFCLWRIMSSPRVLLCLVLVVDPEFCLERVDSSSLKMKGAHFLFPNPLYYWFVPRFLKGGLPSDFLL
jgi:hypothetical protein